MSDNIRDHTIQVEVVKTNLRQTKDGTYITFVLNPNDNVDRLTSAHVGQRYMMVLAEIDDNEEVVPDEEGVRKRKAIASAGLLCRQQAFQGFLAYETGRIILEEQVCEDVLREYLGVKSRSELNTKPEALNKFLDLRARFLHYVKRHPNELQAPKC